METQCHTCSSSCPSGFKSYYVVWKPLFLGNMRKFRLEFKSYYVVWKLFHRSKKPSNATCLNRTMQYGNFSIFLFDFFVYFGLNRTMQYGNCPRSHFLPFSLDSLNRTMQYGNIEEKNNQKNKKRKFKSYYVVWKLLFQPYKRGWIISLNRTMQYGNSLASYFRQSSQFV